MLALDPAVAADRLDVWFTQLRTTLDNTVFAVGASEAHQRAAARNVVTRHVIELEAAVAAGQPVIELREIAWILAGTTRTLGLTLRRAQWLAAAQNVVRLVEQVEALPSPWVGDAVSIFREQFLETLRQAGVTRAATNLGPENRTTALGLSVNWGLRYLIAAAAGLRDHEVTDPGAREVVAALTF